MFKAVEFDNAAKERIRQASELERRTRLDALLGAETDLGGILVRPIKARDVLEMEYANNNLFCSSTADSSDYAHFFWTLKPKRINANQRKYVRDAIILLEYNDQLKRNVKTFIDSQFYDLPRYGRNEAPNDFSSTVWLTPVLDVFAEQYGWTLDYILDQNVAVLFQMMQYIMERKTGGKRGISNPITQRAKSIEMQRLNNG